MLPEFDLNRSVVPVDADVCLDKAGDEHGRAPRCAYRGWSCLSQQPELMSAPLWPVGPWKCVNAGAWVCPETKTPIRTERASASGGGWPVSSRLRISPAS
jgi:hypothetical protein